MSNNVTPVLHLNLPPFDSAPWDEDVNDNFAIIDGAIAQVFGVANFAGLWKNSTQYLQGQEVIDDTDSSFWMSNATHTSLDPPATFADERTANPGLWTQVGSSAADYAQAAADAASAAISASGDSQAAQQAAAASAIAAEASAQSAANELSNALLRSGGTMTGPLILSIDPTTNLGAATKQYVDARVGGVGFVKTSGDTMSGPLVVPTPAASNQAATKGYVDTQNALYLPLTGGTLSGNLTFSAGNLTLTNGTSLISDSVNFAFNFSGDHWRFLYQRSTGSLFYQNNAATNLFYISGGGDTVTRGTVYGGGVYSYGNVDGNYLNSRGSATVSGGLTVGDFSSNGNCNIAGYIWSRNGRVISYNSGNNPSVSVWDQSSGAGGMWFGSGSIAFGAVDGSGNPTASWFWANGGGFYVNPGAGGYAQHIFSDSGNSYYDFGGNWRWQWNTQNANLAFYSPWISNFNFVLDPWGTLNITGAGNKPGGGSWGALSDARAKTEVRPYDDSGLAELLRLRPIWYTYNEASGIHDTDKLHIGMIAQEVENIMPELVTQTTGKIGGVEVTDYRMMDITGLTYAVINALRTINDRLEALENA